MHSLLVYIAGIPGRIAQSIKERRMISIYRKIILKASYAGSPFIKYYLSHKTTTFIMGCLQLISFFTTYAGAKYYFADIFSLAPLAFTIGIQFAFFAYSNKFSKTERDKKKTLVLMTLFCLISATFSYTGLATSTLPPENEYEKTYNEYVSAAESIKEQLLQKNSTEQEIDLDAQNLLTNAEALLRNAQTQSTSLQTQIDISQALFNEDITSTTYTDRNGNTSRTSSTGTAGSAAASGLPNLVKLKSQIDGEITALTDAKNSLTSEQIIDYIHDPDNNVSLSSSITNLLTCYNTLSTTLNSQNQLPDSYVEDLCQKYDNYTELKNATDDLPASEEDKVSNTLSLDSLPEKFIQWITADSSAEQALENLNRKRDIVEKNYLNLINLTQTVDAAEIDLTNLNNSRDKLNAYGDPNLQAIAYIGDDQYRSKVLGILFLALLIDGLTWFLAIIGSQRPLPLLDSKTNREIDNEDHLFSIIFVSLLGGGTPTNLSIYDGKESFKKACIQYVNDIKTIIHKFLLKFHNSPWTNQWGYGLYAKYKDLKSIENVVPIVSILQQLGYLQLISPNDFQLLKENYHGITRDQSDEYNNPICELDEYICLLRYRVELYLRNNTAEIAMNFTPFSDETEKAEGETE